MSLNELSRGFDRDIYNGLLTIEEANKTARADDGLDEFLNSASRLFVSHNLHHRFGVGLLHNHNQCQDDERMIQYNCTVNNEKALVTMPVSKDTDLQSEVPSVWALSGRNFYPLEFTTDRVAQDLLFAGEVPTPFLEDYVDLVNSSPVGSMFGLAVVERTMYRFAHPNQIALEQTDTTERKNVVFLRSRGAVAKSIQTAWTFEAHANAAAGTIRAETHCAATCRTECIIDNGVHSGPIHFDHHIVAPD